MEIDMQIFLHEFFVRAKAIDVPGVDRAPKLSVEAESGEMVIGTLNDDLKKLFVVMEEITRGLEDIRENTQALCEKIYPQDIAGKDGETVRKYLLDCVRIPILNDILSHMLKEMYFTLDDVMDDFAVGIREGWKVVKFLPQNSRDINIFVRGSFPHDSFPKNPGA